MAGNLLPQVLCNSCVERLTDSPWTLLLALQELAEASYPRSQKGASPDISGIAADLAPYSHEALDSLPHQSVVLKIRAESPLRLFLALIPGLTRTGAQ